MNDKNILFVTCVNNEKLYGQMVQCINNLKVPQTYSIDFLPIYGARSMTSGYNQALKSEAKYKVYLHQDVLIKNMNFIYDIIQLFRSSLDLGIIGIAGCKELPQSGVWWEGKKLFGKVTMWNRTVQFGEVTKPFELVTAVDGVLLATQYDVSWREDLFQGFHFYDISQSLEFQRNGYQVGVPKQVEPWCHHLDADVSVAVRTNEYKESQQIFIRNYRDLGEEKYGER